MTWDFWIKFDCILRQTKGSLVGVWSLRLGFTKQLWALRIVKIGATFRVFELAIDFKIALKALKACVYRVREASTDGVGVSARRLADVNCFHLNFIWDEIALISVSTYPARHNVTASTPLQMLCGLSVL